MSNILDFEFEILFLPTIIVKTLKVLTPYGKMLIFFLMTCIISVFIFHFIVFLLQDRKGPEIWQVTMHAQGNLCWWLHCRTCYPGALFYLHLILCIYFLMKNNRCTWNFLRKGTFCSHFIHIDFTIFQITSIMQCTLQKLLNILIFTPNMCVVYT